MSGAEVSVNSCIRHESCPPIFLSAVFLIRARFVPFYWTHIALRTWRKLREVDETRMKQDLKQDETASPTSLKLEHFVNNYLILRLRFSRPRLFQIVPMRLLAVVMRARDEPKVQVSKFQSAS